jgi:LemA protein
MLTGTLKSLFALSEAYPQLQAAESFNRLQESLNEIEGAVQNARRYYNAVVRDYNTKVEQFPSVLVANAFRFQKEEFFELAEPEQREAPQVQFGSGED